MKTSIYAKAILDLEPVAQAHREQNDKELFRLTRDLQIGYAKHLVKELENDAVGGTVSSTILDFFRKKDKIGAIRVWREHTHLGLKEAKDAIEAKMLDLGFGYRSESGAILFKE